MLYREFGTTGKKLSALGMGSTRFRSEDLDDEAGLERCADLVVRATELGINYFDIAHNYAKSQCETIYKKAFKRIKTPFFTSAKTSCLTDVDADAVMRRVYSSLEHMEIEKIDFFYMWSIMNLGQYHDIMRKGGPYEGALRAKEEGLIEHLIFSSHALPEETEYILSEQAFEGGLISYSLLNFTPMQKVLAMAKEKKQGLLVMNPLAGGLVPQNPNYFRSNFNIEENVVDFALKFVYSHEPITCVLSGVSRESELLKNVEAIEAMERPHIDYVQHVSTELTKLSNICTGCGYCIEGCPQKIRIPAYMQSYNMKFMDDTETMYGRTDGELISDILVMKKLNLDYQELPEKENNPCVRCGKCEKICTQHLPIIERLDEVYQIAERTGATQQGHKERLEKLLKDKEYCKVAFYTGGGYTAYVMEEYKKYFGELPCEVLIVDSNEQKWGSKLGNHTIVSPEQMEKENPDCVLIANFNYSEEIYRDLLKKFPKLYVVKLHEETDAPWVF